MKNYIKKGALKMNTLTKIIIWAFFIVAGLYLTNKFFDSYRLRTPIILQSPIEKRYQVPSKPKKSQEGAKFGQILALENTLTIDQTIADYIKSKDWDYSTAIKIAKSENAWNLTKSFDCKRIGGPNKDGTYDHGLWQINDIHIRSGSITLDDANDCFKSTDFAYKLYKGHNNSFVPWSAYNNGSYLNHNEVVY